MSGNISLFSKGTWMAKAFVETLSLNEETLESQISFGIVGSFAERLGDCWSQNNICNISEPI
jgi:hypothetical protein